MEDRHFCLSIEKRRTDIPVCLAHENRKPAFPAAAVSCDSRVARCSRRSAWLRPKPSGEALFGPGDGPVEDRRRRGRTTDALEEDRYTDTFDTANPLSS